MFVKLILLMLLIVIAGMDFFIFFNIVKVCKLFHKQRGVVSIIQNAVIKLFFSLPFSLPLSSMVFQFQKYQNSARDNSSLLQLLFSFYFVVIFISNINTALTK